MNREVVLATVVSATWLSICFVSFGVLYSIMVAVGGAKFLELEQASGWIDLVHGASISRLSLGAYVGAMLLATFPINLYWSRRLNRSQ